MMASNQNSRRCGRLLSAPPEDLQEKYATLVKLGAVVEDNEAEQKKNASSSSAEAGDDEKKKRRRKGKKKKSERLTASS